MMTRKANGKTIRAERRARTKACRNHGACAHCRSNRTNRVRKAVFTAAEQVREFKAS